ncbi:MAG: CRISPR-associated endonuclease Cas2 [Candidatus Sungiibacteriota bacterium]
MAKFVELALMALQFQAEGLLEIADILFATPAKARRQFSQPLTYEWLWFKDSWADLYRDRRQFQRTLQYLKRQGLIAKKAKAHGSWALTQRGTERAKQYQATRGDPFSKANATFIKPHGNGITIVAYDIPERERRKRDWVRLCLIEMGCEMIQKSVWVAKGMIDEDFMHALRDRDLLGHVHIFSVTKQGTIHVGAL